MEINEIKNIVEGILFAMGGTVEASRIAKALEIEEKQVVEAINALKESYLAENRGLTITEIDGAYQMCTNPDIYEYLIRIAKQPRKYVLTDVLLETLSIIAYKQPITKSEIEKIRGVSCDFAVSKLVEFG
ncbi:MAG: SMC-Scp complex subunit ScpB, partial [Pseudobutyrivibrio sp.]|nr:SMC-Scp complex subunit ScpB [Pseudobutyrivibrio sp.]